MNYVLYYVVSECEVTKLPFLGPFGRSGRLGRCGRAHQNGSVSGGGEQVWHRFGGARGPLLIVSEFGAAPLR